MYDELYINNLADKYSKDGIAVDVALDDNKDIPIEKRDIFILVRYNSMVRQKIYTKSIRLSKESIVSAEFDIVDEEMKKAIAACIEAEENNS